MNYNEIAFLAKQKKITIENLAKEAGLKSRQGLQSSVQGKSIKMENIELLCNYLDITPNEFFGWNEETPSVGSGNFASHVSGGNTQNSNETIKALKDQLKEKDKQIDRLLKIIEKNNLK